MEWNQISVNRQQIYGISIIWIMIFHFMYECGNVFEQQWLFSVVMNNGNIGVDIFLFISGISLYFSKAKGIKTLDFYKKRINKIGTVYLFFCIPFYILYWFMSNQFGMAIKEILFLNLDTNHFWYLLCIAVCYLIYPLINYCIIKDKKFLVYIFLGGYLLGLIILIHYNQGVYYSLNKLITRIPIFLIGSLAGEYVYKKKYIEQWLVLLMIIAIFIKRPIEKFLFIKVNCQAYSHCFDRLYNGAIAIGLVFLLCMIIPYFSSLKSSDFVNFMGKYTLELYVLHIAIRDIIKVLFGMPFDRNPIAFTIFYFMLPVAIIFIYENIKVKRVKN